MFSSARRLIILISMFLLLGCGLNLDAQYREYYIFGQILDSNSQPLSGVEIDLLNKENSLTFNAKTDKEGRFKFVGLPHGVYQVSISHAGYEAKTVEWNCETSQEKMARVEIPTIMLASSQEILQMEQNKQMKKDLDDATEKISKLDYDGALDILKKALERDPQNVNALYLAGLSYAKKKIFPEAKAALEPVTILTPDFAPAHFQLGICYQQTDDEEKALAQYREVMRLDPKNLDNYFNAALVLFELDKPQEALESCLKILPTRPNDPDVNEMAGRCQLQLADYVQALAYFEKAMALTSDEAKKKSLSEIIDSLQKAVKQK